MVGAGMPDPNNLIFRDHGIAWVGLCKNANTAIKTAFAESLNLEYDKIHDAALFEYASLRQVASSGLWRFAIVRNPYDRIESCWRDKCFDGYQESFSRWKIRHEMPFEQFVDMVVSTPDDKCQGFGQHWRSQVNDLMIHGRIVVDYLGRFECMSESWETVRQHSRIELPDLPRINGTDHQAPWTRELREKVQQRYQRDFEALGYGY